MPAKPLVYEPERRTPKPEAFPTTLKHKVFSIVNVSCEAADATISCKQESKLRSNVRYNLFITLNAFILFTF